MTTLNQKGPPAPAAVTETRTGMQLISRAAAVLRALEG
jgi:hypothetical protein